MTHPAFRPGLAVALLASLLSTVQADPSLRVEIGATTLHAEETSLAPGFVFGGSFALARWAPLSSFALEPHIGMHFARRNAGLEMSASLALASLAIDSLEIPLLLRGELLLGGRVFHVMGGVYASRLLRVQAFDPDGTRQSADTGTSVDLGFVAGVGMELTALAWGQLSLELRYQRGTRPNLPESDARQQSVSLLVGYELDQDVGPSSSSSLSSGARSLALRAGLIATRLASSRAKSTFAPSGGPGFSLGAALVPARMGARWLSFAPQLELAFTRHSTENPAASPAESADGSLALDTLDTALLMRGDVTIADRTFFAHGGMYGSLRLDVQHTRDGLVSDGRDMIPALDGGWLAGAGIEFSATSRVRLSVEARYQRSLRDPAAGGLTRDSLAGLIGLTIHRGSGLAFGSSTLIGHPGDRWLHMLRFTRIERATRDGQFGYEISYDIAGHGNLALFWPRERIDLTNSAPGYRLRSMKLGKHRLRFPDRITRRSLPRVHHYLLEIERNYAAQADGAIAAMGGFSVVAGLAGLKPTLRTTSPRATANTTSKPSGRTRARAKAKAKAKKSKAQKTRAQQSSQSSAGTAANGGTAAARATGQLHHAISRRIHWALEQHRNLKGYYKVRDPRFVTRGVDGAAHRGYQRWHRQLDREVMDWIRKTPDATPAQFESYLRRLYAHPVLKARFPGGL